MKKLLPFFIVFMGLMTVTISCNNKTTPRPNDDKVIHVDANRNTVPHSLEEDCHGVRKTIHSLNDEEGEIVLIGNNVTISVPPGNKRYKICDSIEELKVEGLKVKFSGVVLEIFPNERLMGIPFRLSKIDIVK